MKKQKPQERREYMRFDVRSKINFQVKEKRKGQASSEKASAISKNISVAGISFISETKLEPGSRVKLEILLPSESKPLHLEGEVGWSRPLEQERGRVMFTTGVKLFTIDKKDEGRFVRCFCEKMTERLSRYLHL